MLQGLHLNELSVPPLGPDSCKTGQRVVAHTTEPVCDFKKIWLLKPKKELFCESGEAVGRCLTRTTVPAGQGPDTPGANAWSGARKYGYATLRLRYETVTGPVRSILLPRPITSPTLYKEFYKDECW